jgi:tripeptidyl-peptidase-1
LISHIDYITPGIKMTPVVKRSIMTKRSKTSKHSGFELVVPENWSPPTGLPPDLQYCGFNMTAPCIKALYGIPDAPKHPKSSNGLGLYEQGDYFAKSDLDLYWKTFAPHIPQGTYPIPALIDGANFSVPAYSELNGGESNIDIEMS